MADLAQSDGNSQHSDSDDQDFDVSAEMMIDDHDDERTLEEEEALSNSENVEGELSQLENEKDMPIEQLLAMYGYGNRAVPPRIPGSGEVSDELAEDQPHGDFLLGSGSSLTARLLRSGDQLSDDEDEGSMSGSSEADSLDMEPEPRPEDWKKTIQVGSEYQAEIPDCVSQTQNSETVSADTHVAPVDLQVWDPAKLPESDVVRYLRESHERKQASMTDGVPQALGAVVYDDEHVLHRLHELGYSVNDALAKSSTTALGTFAEDGVFSQWSEEECRNFENGLCTYGKNFFQIQRNKVPSRSVGDLIQFYYLWKKTERHDFFASKYKLEKKKYALHPGITDYMDRFLDEADNSSGSPNTAKADRVVSPDSRLLSSTHSGGKQPSSAPEDGTPVESIASSSSSSSAHPAPDSVTSSNNDSSTAQHQLMAVDESGSGDVSSSDGGSRQHPSSSSDRNRLSPSNGSSSHVDSTLAGSDPAADSSSTVHLNNKRSLDSAGATDADAKSPVSTKRLRAEAVTIENSEGQQMANDCTAATDS